jgi:hypothetical protein
MYYLNKREVLKVIKQRKRKQATRIRKLELMRLFMLIILCYFFSEQEASKNVQFISSHEIK